MNTLVVADLHEPFCKKGYLEFCIKTKNEFNCERIVFIGDLVDNHYSSFHDTDPDGYGGGMELRVAISRIEKWYEAFPKAYVTLGNHDLIIQRKAFSAGIPMDWIKDFKEMFNTPNWVYDESFEFNNVLYTHGTKTSGDNAALKKALYMRRSVVQGHLHSYASVQYTASDRDRLFGMIVGCGVDQTAYPFAYSKNHHKKFIVSCGVVIDDKYGLIIPM